MLHYRVNARLKGSKDPFPNNQRSSQQHSHCSCTSSSLKPDTNGFPGSRPQHEAIESPKVTVCEFSGFCNANTHDQLLLWAVIYISNCNPGSSWDTKYQKCLTQCHKHQESRCTEGLKIVLEQGIFLAAQACSDLWLTPWFHESWDDHWDSRGNKVRQRSLQLLHLSMYWEECREGRTDKKEQDPKAASGFGLALGILL